MDNMYKLLIVTACVILILHKGTCQDASAENTNSQELQGSVECVVTEEGITVCNQKTRTGKKKPDQRVKEKDVSKDDETRGILDAITEFMNDGIRFFEGENDKNVPNEEDQDYSNEDVTDDGYDKFDKKGENDDDDDDDYDDEYRDDDDKDDYDDDDDDDDDGDDDDDDDDDSDYREDADNVVDNSNRTTPVKTRSKRQISVQQGSEGKRRRKKNVLMKLFMIGMFLKSKLSTILSIFGTFMQLKFFAIAILNLIVGLVRLYLDMTRRSNQHQKVIYYEQAHHEHVYDQKHEDKGWLNGWLSKQDQVDPQEFAYSAHVPL